MTKLLAEYLTELKRLGRAENTLDAYERDLRHFIEFLIKENLEFNEFDEIEVSNFIDYLLDFNMSRRTISRHLVSIRNFYKFLRKKNMVEEAPILFFELPEIKRNLPDTLSLREIEIFLDMPDLSTLKGLRDRAILEVLYGAGLKATELINLKVRDADLTRGYIRVKERNGSEREVPIGNYAIESIENYLSKREDNISPASALFPSSRNEAMSRQGLWKILKGYEEMSNIDQNININTLRHSYAVHMLEGGADLNTVSNLMGHKDVNSTAVYLKLVKNKKIKEVYKNSHPRA